MSEDLMVPGRYYVSNKSGHKAQCMCQLKDGRFIIQYLHHTDDFFSAVAGKVSDSYKHWTPVSSKGYTDVKDTQGEYKHRALATGSYNWV